MRGGWDDEDVVRAEGPDVRRGWARSSAAGTGGSDGRAGGAQIMKSRGRRLSVKDKIESKPSGVPRLRVLLALCAALLVVGIAAGCGSEQLEQQQLGRQLGRFEHDVDGRREVGRPDGQRRRQRLRRSTWVRSPAALLIPASRRSSSAGSTSRAARADVGPGSTKGADLAVKYLNEKLGGIDGHPVKLFKCFTSTSEEQGQTCGQKMVNNKDVHVIAMGAVVIGDQSLVATVNGQKPMVTSVAIGAADRRTRTVTASSATASGSPARSPRTRRRSSEPSRHRSSGPSSPASTRARRRSSTAPRSWAWTSRAWPGTRTRPTSSAR